MNFRSIYAVGLGLLLSFAIASILPQPNPSTLPTHLQPEGAQQPARRARNTNHKMIADGAGDDVASLKDTARESSGVSDTLTRATQLNWGLSAIDSTDAWKITTGSRKVVVAIIDTGADVNHPDLKDNLWTNPGETGVDSMGHDKSNNGQDDDGNGFVDDIHGWNFADDNSDLTDNHGHGTHIAGIVGASGAKSYSGVSPHVSLMVLKYYDPRGTMGNPMAATIKAIRYATAMGADIINYSGGGLTPSALERASIDAASRKHILFIAAAGNEHADSDAKPFYPADYGLTNVISVTAVDSKQTVLPSSNWGMKTVDLAAPGERIFSTLPGGTYGMMTGTSQATAFVTGVAALLLAHDPELHDPLKMKTRLLETASEHDSLNGRLKTRATLNSRRALVMSDGATTLSGIALEARPELDSSLLVRPAP